MTKLLEKDAVFDFSKECIEAFKLIKEKLTNAPIMVSPDWSQPFELICDASDFAVGAVLGKQEGKHFHPIHFANKTLNNAQQNYTVTEKELLAVIFSFNKFRSYLVLLKIVIFTDHYALKYMFVKKDAKPRLIRWILLLQEFDIEIKNKKRAENVAANHFLRLKNPHLEELRDDDIDDNFLDETLMNVSSTEEDIIPWRCVYGAETQKILDECHHGSTEGYYGPSNTTKKVFDDDFYWPTIFKETHTLVQDCPSSTDAFAFPLSAAGDLPYSGAGPSLLDSCFGASSTSATLTVVSTTHTPDC
nr:reverse transcriptase domain-containing protein [Tanacetum cinerariifolium]